MMVLSLFDGMSCGQIALNQLGIKVDKYYASEIDKWAIQVTQANYPDTVQLGDITKWREWDIDWASIDLVYGGSPCQGFSFAGKQLAFDDPRSKLFFVFEDIVKHIMEQNPNAKFLLENVRMKKEYLDVITERMGVEPVKINSALVSAQNRVRYYWTNIGEIEQPEDRGILLKDIIEDGDVDEQKARTIEGKSLTLTTMGGGHREPKIAVREATKKGYAEAGVGEGLDLTFPNSKTRRGRLMSTKSNCLTSANYEYGIIEPDLTWRKLTPLECERLQCVPDNYTNHVSNTQRYRMLGNGWTVEVIKHIFKELNNLKSEKK